MRRRRVLRSHMDHAFGANIVVTPNLVMYHTGWPAADDCGFEWIKYKPKHQIKYQFVDVDVTS